MSQQYAVQVSGLCKNFGSVDAVKNCSLTVERGSIYGFLGANGAGKTTVFKLLMGFLRPSMGTVSVLGKDAAGRDTEVLKKIGCLIETPVFYEHLSAVENLKIHLAYMEMENAGTEECLSAVGLEGVREQPVSQFSLGMRQRLAIARAISHHPELLILDEPINGLDPMGIREMRELFRTLVEKKGMTILISSHILSEIEQTADKVGIIDHGTVLKETMLATLKKEYPDGLEDYFMNLVSGRKSA